MGDADGLGIFSLRVEIDASMDDFIIFGSKQHSLENV